MNRRFIDGVKYLNTYLFLIYISVLGAQDETRPTVAILDFEGQDISVQEVQTLTERMRTEIGNTNAVQLIERFCCANANPVDNPHPNE